LSGKNMDYQSISELLQRIQATGLLRRYAPRNDGPKNRTVQRNLNLDYIFYNDSNIAAAPIPVPIHMVTIP
ncbi:hypothetical protein SC984_14145, partial [Legionella pneumophila serogroup 1]|nr:hypothetical protein [Legionella pneumophila]